MLPDDLPHLHRIRLSDHLTLVPVTSQLLQQVVATFGEYKSEDDPYEDSLLMRLLPPLTQMAVKVSSVSAVLYIEVDVASGIGDRLAIVWHKGEAVYGPTWGTSQVAEAFKLFGQLAAERVIDGSGKNIVFQRCSTMNAEDLAIDSKPSY